MLADSRTPLGILHLLQHIIATMVDHVRLQLLLREEDDGGALITPCQASPGQ